MRYFFYGFAILCLLVAVIAGPQGKRSPGRPLEFFPDMVRQNKVKPQSPSSFFADGIGPRMPVPGTVPMGYEIPREHDKPGVAFTTAPDYYNTGKMGDKWGTGIPVPVTEALLKRGQERFTINCAICHGATGGGNGVTSKYNWPTIANYQDERIVKMADGEIFNTLTNGKNTMMGYGSNIQVADRWAIISYIRALQRVQHATVADLTPEQRAALK